MKKITYQENTFVCGCGRLHQMPISEVVIGSGALKELRQAPLRLHLGRKALLVTDEAIMGIMGEMILHNLEQAGCQVEVLAYLLPVVPDEKRLMQFMKQYHPDLDFFVAAGTGAVNDITRFFSAKLERPYLSIPTAPSMDGYSAKVSLLFIDGVKQTLNTIYPKAIYADINYLKNAPRKLLAAGVGDLAAKISACADWKISALINGEYCCQQTIHAVEKTVQTCMISAGALAAGKTSAVQALTDGLIFSGIAMHWVDSSRPAAGAEHHITHFWGMRAGAPQHLHGIECAVGTMLMFQIYKAMLQVDFQDIDAKKLMAQYPTVEEWKEQIHHIFQDQADVIFHQQAEKTFDKALIRERIGLIQARQAEIKSIIREALESGKMLEQALKQLGAPTSAEELGIPKELLRESLLWAKELRSKYTVLDMAYDLGVLEKLVDQIC